MSSRWRPEQSRRRAERDREGEGAEKFLLRGPSIAPARNEAAFALTVQWQGLPIGTLVHDSRESNPKPREGLRRDGGRGAAEKEAYQRDLRREDRRTCTTAWNFCPAFWDWLAHKGNTGSVFSIDKVADEIEAGQDELSDWATEHGHVLFRRTPPALAPQFTQVST